MPKPTPRRGKGKPMEDQAAALLRQHLDLSSRHAAKLELSIRGGGSTGRIHSLRTFEKYAASLRQAGEWARENHGLRHLSDLTPEQAQGYLEHRAASKIGQRHLDIERRVLEFVTGQGSLRRVAAEVAKPRLTSRFYTPIQVEMVQRAQTESNALATRIAYEAGLRAHELLTLRRTGEDQASRHRQWRPERFQGRQGIRYVVTGKGGLKREVLLSRETAARLEERRLEAPREVVDRGIRYRQVYDLGGGNRWAVSFSAASERALGWSRGAHGLRHSYAQERLRELQGLRDADGKPAGLYYREAKEVVSQELGHFREDIVNTYLR
jgi:integrase